MTVYTATPEMCHTEVNYGEDLLPHDWPGKKFRLDGEGSIARLDSSETSFAQRWNIKPELTRVIKASVATEETPTDPELMALKAANERMETTITQQLEELERLRGLVTTKEEALLRFKRRVGEVAMEYGERHDWCSVVREALDELGVEVPTKQYSFTLSVVYRVTGTKESYGDPDPYTLQQYLSLDTDDVTLSMDDWGDFEVEYVQHDVMDVEEVQE